MNSMTMKNIAKKVAGVLPFGSLIVYMGKQWDKPREERDTGLKMEFKVLGHGLYLAGAIAYLACGSTYNTWTSKQYIEAFEKIKIEITQKEEYKQKLFGENGYADKDGEKGISASERFEFYKKVGLEDKIIFPELSVEDLEKAIDSYEAENQQP